MFRSKLPRLYELKDGIVDPANPDAYFQNFDENLTDSAHIQAIYLLLEQVLQELDISAWKHLKEETRNSLTMRDRHGRGWRQLFDLLNEARAYRYLKIIGGTNLRFIPREEWRTPDLECVLGSNRVLCEVKTINTSDQEVCARTESKVRSIEVTLSAAFLTKLRSTIDAARQQMLKFDGDAACLRFVYVNILFDDFLAEYKERYFKQIDDELLKTPEKGVRLVFCNEYTPFYKSLEMNSADVDNLGEIAQGFELKPT